MADVRAPNAVERIFNTLVGALVRVGIGKPKMRVLEVRGRKSGKLYSLPVDLLQFAGKTYLVAPRGHTQWVQNAEAAGVVTLRRGSSSARYSLRKLAAPEKPPVLKAYLDEFKSEVGRFFPVPAGSPAEAFAPIAERYPAFELTQQS
jgi:deazaflavin-dependent oxidoreductase (nitroreductase family)